MDLTSGSSASYPKPSASWAGAMSSLGLSAFHIPASDGRPRVAKSLLAAVLACRVRDAKLRDEAVRSAKSACLNIAEGAGRVTRADKARSFAIARAEAVESAAAVEIAALCGDAPEGAAAEVARVA